MSNNILIVTYEKYEINKKILCKFDFEHKEMGYIFRHRPLWSKRYAESPAHVIAKKKVRFQLIQYSQPNPNKCSCMVLLNPSIFSGEFECSRICNKLVNLKSAHVIIIITLICKCERYK